MSKTRFAVTTAATGSFWSFGDIEGVDRQIDVQPACQQDSPTGDTCGIVPYCAASRAPAQRRIPRRRRSWSDQALATRAAGPRTRTLRSFAGS